MLNELLLVERGMRDAGIGMTQRHPDVSDAGGKATLVVQLDAKGGIAKVYPLPPGVTPWTMRNGKHNSFPFVQVGIPLWKLDEKERDDFAKIQRTDTTVRCTALTQMAAVAQFDNAAFEKWPAAGLLKSLKERSGALKSIPNNPDVYIASTAIKHFLCAAESADGGKELLGQVVQEIVGHLKQTAQSDWVDIAASLLVGKKNKNEWKSDGALLFEASGFSVCIADSRLVGPLSAALQAASGGEETKEAETARATCALTGVVCELHAGNYPQPTLPAGLGQAYLSAVKNTATPASGRYGQFAADAMPVGGDVIVRLDAALRELTVPERKNKTWRSIPGEAPKKNDLLLAFVRGCLDAPVASVLMDQDADVPDYSEEDGNAATEIASSIAAFEKRTERMVEAVRGQFEGDFTKTPVDLMVLRKLDPGNRKVVYANSLSLHDLKTAAEAWAEGERNVPEWFTLPIYFKGEKKSKQMPPPHVSPLGLIGFYKRTYIRDGGEFANVASVPASEVLRLFLDVGSGSSLRVGR
ncbi:TPA: hypothetical protein DDW35_10345, partial [Candidatus Sumerlaeota bacterium]|nr:hypothetical protein [Candidatus Sumerlaeota bacterium]